MAVGVAGGTGHRPPGQAVLDTRLPRPTRGRTFSDRRRVRLSDVDAHGRLRLDGVARFLQDVAMDDVEETGWGLPDHVWVLRRIRMDVLRPFVGQREVTLTTWCSGVSAIAAGRRWSLRGEDGRIEVDSVWIHLDADQRPARIGDFGVYAEAAGGRTVSTRLELPDPPPAAPRLPWPLRATDLDRHGHVNNTVYWQAVEHLLPSLGVDVEQPLRADLDYRRPIDVGDEIDVAPFPHQGGQAVGFLVGDEVRAVAALAPLP